MICKTCCVITWHVLAKPRERVGSIFKRIFSAPTLNSSWLSFNGNLMETKLNLLAHLSKLNLSMRLSPTCLDQTIKTITTWTKTMKFLHSLCPTSCKCTQKAKVWYAKLIKKKCQLLPVCYDLLSYVDEWEAQSCGQSRWLFDYQMFS